MIPKDCKRLAEVDFPLAAVNSACQRENNKKTRPDSGHISLLHTWWARRPLASCRSVLLGILLPDPSDSNCPLSFKDSARKILSQFRKIGVGDGNLKHAMLTFISEISDAELVGRGGYFTAARDLVKAAWDESPHVFDPFAGGGSISLEALRLGCDTTSSELNPVAWLLLKVTLDWSARFGPELVELYEKWSEWVLKEAERRLAPYYPIDNRNRRPLAYLWARSVQCEAPGCGVTIPLVRNLWLSQSKHREKFLRFSYLRGSTEPVIEIFTPQKSTEPKQGTVYRFKAICPKCNQVMPRERVQAQLQKKAGGANDSILLAIVRENHGGRSKDYYSPTPHDLEVVRKASKKVEEISIELPPFPSGDTRAFPPYPYGISNWADALTSRQLLSRWIIHETIEDALREAKTQVKDLELHTALAACLYTSFSDNAQYHTSLCVWLSEGIKSIFIQGSGIPMRADFVEGSPLSPNCEGLSYSMKSVTSALKGLLSVRHQPSSPLKANALDTILPRESVQVIFTDPPYYDSIPYAHLSDFFYGWLRLGLRKKIPNAFDAPVTEKAMEITKNMAVVIGGIQHNSTWYEKQMTIALSQAEQVLSPDGIASIIFAHKSTEGWESLVNALVKARWVVTASWPILTERAARMRAQGWAALASSIHLVCRPRSESASIGDWGEVLRELPKRVVDWVERLQLEGIRGADLVFACIGPALEIFSRYSKVETAEGREVGLSEYLEKVWEVVGRMALEQVLGTAEARARNSAAGALEEDARLTALFLWTLQSTNGSDGNGVGEEEDEKSEEDEEEKLAKGRLPGFSLIYDVARRFALPLGIHLQEWEGRIIETKKGVVRLLPIEERAKQLFGEEGASQMAQYLERSDPKDLQMFLFPDSKDGVAPVIRGRGGRKKIAPTASEDVHSGRREATTLDRVHAAMLLQKSGQTNALRALLKSEQERGPDFLRLANALSALYPKTCEEKRLLDAMLQAIPR